MDPKPNNQRRSVFKVLTIDLNAYAPNAEYNFQRNHIEEFSRLERGSRIELNVGKLEPFYNLEWLPPHLSYCVRGSDPLNNEAWARIIGGEA